MQMQRSASHSPPRTKVFALPSGLLGPALIQHLPWRKRVQVEGVCRSWQREALAYGWEDVKHFKWNDVPYIECTWWLSMLTRIGRHLTTMEVITSNFPLSLPDNNALHAGLLKFPRLKHLSMSCKVLTHPLLNHILRTYGPCLKSLSLDVNRLRVPNTSEDVAMFNEALSCLSSLEYMKIKWTGAQRPHEELRFPAHFNLRHLNLDFWDCRKILSEEYLAVLVTQHSLRSFSLMCPFYNMSFLQCFTHLEHLTISVDESNVESFVNALPHLGKSLRALELPEILSVAMLRQILHAVIAQSPKLEHLGLIPPWWKMEVGDSPTWPDPRVGCLIIDWEWLKSSCQDLQLEYLDIGRVPSTKVICSKKLRCLKFGSKQVLWSDEEVRALTEAASSTAAISDRGEDEAQASKKDPLPLLRIGFDRIAERTNDAIADGSRLRFAHLWLRVLYRYKYGCEDRFFPIFNNTAQQFKEANRWGMDDVAVQLANKRFLNGVD